jgi:DNA-binding response OmpR family regulator
MEKEKVLEMDHLKTRFFANISHEFRTPLTLILGPLEKLKENRSGLMTLSREAAASMKRNARRLLQLVNQLLDISRLETGGMTIQASKGDLEGFVRTIILSFLSLAESKQIRYTYKLTGTTEKHYFDPDKLEKILANIISNALKYSPSGREVGIEMDFISSAEQSRYTEIKVKDTGNGISPDDLEKIFDRFYQVSDSNKTEVGGTGIGLAVVKEMVGLYRGEIKVESQVGRGSIFTVVLPVSRNLFTEKEIKEEADTESYHSDKTDEDSIIPTKKELDPVQDLNGGNNHSALILIVEDNRDIVDYISDILGEGYRKLWAGNGRSGLELAIEKIPDIIITDVMMPEMDGLEMCRKLKEDKRTNHIPVIVLTAKAGRENKINGLETGAVDYLVKPFDAEELEIRVRNLIEQRQMLWKKFKSEIITEPDLPDLPSPDDQLLQSIVELLNRHLSEPEFKADQMSDELNMSRMQMYRKVNALTGHTPMDLLRILRLKKAASMFEKGHNNIAQVMYQVGFNNQSYFAKCFRNIYKLNPSDYLKEKVR